MRKGEKGTTVVFANRFTVTETDKETGEDQDRKIPFLKAYAVFNVEQIDGLPACYYAMDEGPRLDPDLRNPEAETFIAATKADIRHGGNVAAYSLSLDRILMPHFEFFETALGYDGCVVHELGHWVRHPSRLARDFGRKRWGTELGSAFLCADLNLTPQIEDHAAYLESWLTVLKKDKRAIFTAASHAQRAADYLHGLQPAGSLRPAPGRPSETPEEAGRLPLVPQGENSLAPPPFKDQLDLDL